MAVLPTGAAGGLGRAQGAGAGAGASTRRGPYGGLHRGARIGHRFDNVLADAGFLQLEQIRCRQRVRLAFAPAQLLVLDAPEQRGQVFALTEEVTVGRGGGCGVALNDRMVSQLHARIFRRNGQLFVEDLGSTNGTLLNGQKVSASQPSAIRKGDRLQVGKTVLEVTSGKRGGGGGGAG